jgi:hypothetical protein
LGLAQSEWDHDWGGSDVTAMGAPPAPVCSVAIRPYIFQAGAP